MNVREEAMALIVKSRLAEDTRTFGQMIDVFVADGDIYLVGTCDSEDQRRVACEIVLGLPGVRRVVNNIRIKPAGVRRVVNNIRIKPAGLAAV